MGKLTSERIKSQIDSPSWLYVKHSQNDNKALSAIISLRITRSLKNILKTGDEFNKTTCLEGYFFGAKKL